MVKLNLEALYYYLSYKHVPTPLSMLDGKKRTPAFDVTNIRFAPTVQMFPEEIVDKLDSLLRVGINNTIKENPNIGYLTSGGIDSGVITAIGAELSDKPIKTFCVVYKGILATEGKKSDAIYSRMIAQEYHTEHVELELNVEDYQQALSDIIKCFGEPFSGYMSEYFVSKSVKQYVDTVLTGDWADELFGSYRTHRLAHLNPITNTWDLRYSHVVFTDEEKQLLCNGWAKYSTIEHLKKYSDNLSATDSLNKMLESELRSVFIDQTYLSIDVLSKRHSLNVIGGYSFPDVVDFIAKIPGCLKMLNGDTKYILKKLAIKYLPKEIVYRAKEGFIAPTICLVKGLEPFIRDTLSFKELSKHGLFNIIYINKIVDNFYKNPTEEESYKIWNLVCFQVWYNLFVDGK